MQMNKVIGLCVGVVTTISLGYFFSKSSNIQSNLRKVQKKFCPFEQININKERHILLGRNITEFPTTSQLILSPHLSSSTPKSLKANTITESAFKYLEREREFFENNAINSNRNNSNNSNNNEFDFEDYDYQIERISSEEFDVDSLVAIFVLTDPTYSLKNKKLLIEIANFSKYENIMSPSGHDVARIVFTLRSLYEQFLSNMDINSSKTINSNNTIINSNNTLNKIKTKESLPVFKIYESMREEFNLVVEDILKNLGKKYYKHYQQADLLFQNSLLLLRKQIVKVEAFPCLDLNLFHFSLPSKDENQNNQQDIDEGDNTNTIDNLKENNNNNKTIMENKKEELSNEMRNSDTINKIMKNNQHNLSHIISHNYHNFHLSPIHSSTLPLYSSVFLYGEGDYEMLFRAESSWDYFCEINSRKPHSRPNVSSLLLSLNQLETKLGGKGIWIYENCKDHFVHSSRIFLSDPSTLSSSSDLKQKESIFSALCKDQFKTECVNFLKHQHYPNSPPSKLKSSQLKSSLKSYNSTTEKIQKKVVV